MKTNNLFKLILLVFFGLNINAARAEAPAKADKEDIMDSLDYPELQVVPRASERLLDEARFERDYGIFTHWTYWTSGLMTFYAGNVLSGNPKDPNAVGTEKENAENATKLSQIVGGGSLLLAAYMSFSKPYASQLEKVQKIKGGSRRAELLKERYAEEGLETPAKLISTLNWVIFTSNLLSAAATSASGNQAVNTYAVPAMLASFLPFLFKHSYITVYEKHLEYKRKIYTPLVYLDSTNKTPLVGFNYSF